jgi:hypothetical protein
MLEQGAIVRFFYLWSRQADAGEVSGRKSRPSCIVIRTPTNPAALFLFPITSKQPASDRLHIQISEIECRRCGLNAPSWLILDEFNRVMSDETYDFDSLKQQGTFSGAFMKQIATIVQSGIRSRSIKGVRR